MSINTDLSTAHDNSFALTIVRLPGISFNCTNVSVPGVMSVDIDHETPDLNYSSPTGKLTYDIFTARFLADEDYLNWEAVINWFKEYQTAEDVNSMKSDFSVVIPNNHGFSDLSFDFVNGYPASVDAVELSSAVSEASPVSIGISFKYQSFGISRTKK